MDLTVTRPDFGRLSEAIVLWTGWGNSSWASRDDARVVQAFGQEEARALLPRIRELHHEFYRSDARHTEPDLGGMADKAAQQFRALHPEISEEAIRALAWCYSFDNK